MENLEVVHSFHSSQCVLKHVFSITAKVSSGQSLSCIQHFQPFLAIIEITFSDWIPGGGVKAQEEVIIHHPIDFAG